MNRALLGSVLLRAIAMGSKFIMVTFLGKFLTSAELGTYELMTRTIANAVMLAGMQFFLFANREFAAVNIEDRADVGRNQIAVYSCLYVVVLPLLGSVFIAGFLDWSLCPWFYAILVLDHISYELQRTLTVNSQNVHSNFIHTLRTGLWVFPVLGLMFLSSRFQNLTIVWIFWSTFSLLSVLLSLYWLKPLWKGHHWKPIDWAWIKRGRAVTIQYMPVTLATLAFTLVDRYAIDRLAPAMPGITSRDMVGAYGLYAMMANIIVTFPEAGVAAVYSPLLIKTAADGDFKNHLAHYSALAKGIFQAIAATTALAVIFLLIAIHFIIKKPVYIDLLPSFWFVLTGGIFSALTLWPTGLLYANHKDREMVFLNVGSVIPFLTICFVLVPMFGIMGAAIAMMTGYLIRFLIAWFFAHQTKQTLLLQHS